MKEPIKLYGAATCPQCQGAKQYLESKSVPFEYIDVHKDADGLKQLESMGISTIPVVMSGIKYVKGFSPKELDEFIKEVM